MEVSVKIKDVFGVLVLCLTTHAIHVHGLRYTMWTLDSSDTVSYILFVVGCSAIFFYLAMVAFLIISLITSNFFLHKPCRPEELGDDVPGVSIIKPLMGMDPFQESSLESHFKMTYPKFELLFSVHDDQDPAITVVNKLHHKYPHVDMKLFIGENTSVINPMVQNMVAGYKAAKYEYIWINSSRIEASDEIIYDLAGKLQKPNVSLVHQIPFTNDAPGFGATVEKVYFGGPMARFYICFNTLGLCCITGMTYMFKKSLLDQAHGLEWYGRYLAEDYFLTRALHERGECLMSAVPGRQNGGPSTVSGFAGRMVRWVRLRLNMMTAVTAVFEPMVDIFPLGIWVGWAFYHFFDINPLIFFPIHVLCWCIVDYIVLCRMQNGPLPFSKLQFLLAWVVREFTGTYIFLRAVSNPHFIKWGKKTYKVNIGGLTEILQDDSDEKASKAQHL